MGRFLCQFGHPPGFRAPYMWAKVMASKSGAEIHLTRAFHAQTETTRTELELAHMQVRMQCLAIAELKAQNLD